MPECRMWTCQPKNQNTKQRCNWFWLKTQCVASFWICPKSQNQQSNMKTNVSCEPPLFTTAMTIGWKSMVENQKSPSVKHVVSFSKFCNQRLHALTVTSKVLEFRKKRWLNVCLNCLATNQNFSFATVLMEQTSVLSTSTRRHVVMQRLIKCSTKN